jgi:hypothetical protein
VAGLVFLQPTEWRPAAGEQLFGEFQRSIYAERDAQGAARAEHAERAGHLTGRSAAGVVAVLATGHQGANPHEPSQPPSTLIS